MATSRTYSDACGIARALDVVGARWALLVVRELLFGPLRYSEIVRALPGASTNMVSDRLRELSEAGVVRRRISPASNTAMYELTEWGRELEPVVLALGAWGLRVPKAPDAQLSPTSVMLFLRGAAEIDAVSPGMVIRLLLDERAFTVTVRDGRLHVDTTEPGATDLSLTCSPMTFYHLLCGDLEIDAAIDDGLAMIDGDRTKLGALVATVPNEG